MTGNGYARLQFSWLEDDVFTEVLSGDAVRLYVLMTGISAKNLSDGWIVAREARSLARGEGKEPEDLEELVQAGYLRHETRPVRGFEVQGYVLEQFTEEQKTRAEREAEKEAVRSRVAKSRRKKKASGETSETSSEESSEPQNVTRYDDDTSLDTGSDTSRESNLRSSSSSRSGSRSGSVVASGGQSSSSSGTELRTDARGGGAEATDSGDVDGEGNYWQTTAPVGARARDGAKSNEPSAKTLPVDATSTYIPEPLGALPEVNGSGNYDFPLTIKQAEQLLAQDINPHRFVQHLRKRAGSVGWAQIDWAKTTKTQRFTKTLSTKASERNALGKQLERLRKQ